MYVIIVLVKYIQSFTDTQNSWKYVDAGSVSSNIC